MAVGAGLGLMAYQAAGEVFDDFEAYAPGSNLHGQGGWAGWADDPAAGALVATNFSFSPTRSVNISGASDLVRTFSGVTNGQWVFTVRQYIPSTSTGTNYVILMNTYRPPYAAADLSWSVIIQNNLVAGLVISDLGGGATLPMVKDQWVEVRCEINLASNTVSEFYHGQLLSTHPWRDGAGPKQIQALDLYSDNSGPVYYDNVDLETNCVTNCCLRVSREVLRCATNLAGKFNYSFDLKNRSGVPVKYLILSPATNCFIVMPEVITFQPPLPPGHTTNVSTMISLTGNCPTNLCFRLAALDSDVVQCCSIPHCVSRTAGGPQWVSAVPSCGTNKITVTFDRPLEPATVLGPPNFIVDDLTHGSSLVISGASFGADLKTVCLFTAGPLSAGTQYQLTVNNVKDTCGNAIAPGSRVTFCCSDADRRLNWAVVNGQLCLAWVCDGVLECTSSLAPPIAWAPAPNQSNPQCFTPAGAPKFFRLRQ